MPTYNTPNSSSSYTVPSNVTRLFISAEGAAGGDGGDKLDTGVDGYNGRDGGSGSCELPVSSGEGFTVYVADSGGDGGDGDYNKTGSGGYGGGSPFYSGGSGGTADNTGAGGGGGGGSTALERDSDGALIIVAEGGGGGGGGDGESGGGGGGARGGEGAFGFSYNNGHDAGGSGEGGDGGEPKSLEDDANTATSGGVTFAFDSENTDPGYGSGGSGSVSIDHSVRSPPNASATDLSSTEVEIDADPATNAGGYRIYRDTSPGVTTSDTQIADVSSLPHTDSGLTPGTTYYYLIEAYNSATGTTATSAEVSATPPAPSPDFRDFSAVTADKFASFDTSTWSLFGSASYDGANDRVQLNSGGGGTGGSVEYGPGASGPAQRFTGVFENGSDGADWVAVAFFADGFIGPKTTDSGYEVEFDHYNDNVELFEYSGGSDTSLARTSYSIGAGLHDFDIETTSSSITVRIDGEQVIDHSTTVSASGSRLRVMGRDGGVAGAHYLHGFVLPDEPDGDDLAFIWDDTSDSETGFEVFLSRDGGSTFTSSGTTGADRGVFIYDDALDGERYTAKVRANYTGSSKDSGTLTSTTALAAILADDLTPVDASVEDELTIPNPGATDYGDYRFEFRETSDTEWLAALESRTTLDTGDSLADWSENGTAVSLSTVNSPSESGPSVRAECTDGTAASSEKEAALSTGGGLDLSSSVLQFWARPSSGSDASSLEVGVVDSSGSSAFAGFSSGVTAGEGSLVQVDVAGAFGSAGVDTTSVDTVVWRLGSLGTNGVVYLDTVLYGGSEVVANSNPSHTIEALEDGEDYDIRARIETEHATGSWASVSRVTLLPPPGSVSAAAADTSATVSWNDTADNEDDILVERRRLYESGWSQWSRLSTEPPDTTSYTDGTVIPDATYEWRVSNRTEHSASRATTGADSDAIYSDRGVPPSGWYVELEAADGGLRTFRSGNAERNPSVNGLESVTLTVPKDPAWDRDVWDDADARVWEGGRRLPIDTLVGRDQRAGETVLTLEGTTALHEPDDYEFSNTDMHQAFERVVSDTPYDADIQQPSVENRGFDTVDTQGGFASYYVESGPTNPITIDQSGLRPAQTCFLVEAEDVENNSTFISEDPVGSPNWSGGYAVAIGRDYSDTSAVGFEFTPEHNIPAGALEIAPRYQFYEFAGDFVCRFDGTTVGTLSASDDSTDLGWFDMNGVVQDEYSQELTAGQTYRVTFDTAIGGSNNPGGAVYVDAMAVYDSRYHDSSNFPAPPTGSNTSHLPGPALYPTGGVQATLLHEGFLSATGARLDATITDTSGPQSLSVSNDYGDTYYTTNNGTVVEADFSSAGPDIQARYTLGAWGSASDRTPTQNYKPQTVEAYSLDIDAKDSPPLTNERFVGDRKEILASLVGRGDAMWAAEWDEASGSQVIRMSNVGQLTSDRDLDLVDYEWSTETVGKQVEWAVVKGGKQPVRNESITANHGTAVSLNQSNLITGQEVVRDPDTGEVYTRGTDYEMSTYSTGDIRTSRGGGITDGQQLLVDYEWKPESEYALRTDDRRKKIREKFVGAVSDAVCRSVAFYLVDTLSSPIESGKLTIQEVPPGWSVLETIEADALPDRGKWVPRNIRVTRGGAELDVASRRRAEDVISDVRSRLDSHGDRV